LLTEQDSTLLKYNPKRKTAKEPDIKTYFEYIAVLKKD
jgi:hypothetical protein